MKKIVVIAVLLATLSTYTIVQGDNIQEKVTITATADKKTTFDMFRSKKGVVKGLVTPYEMKFVREDSRFIFKSLKNKANLKIEVKVDNKTTLTADWPIIALIVSDNSMETFGLE